METYAKLFSISMFSLFLVFNHDFIIHSNFTQFLNDVRNDNIYFQLHVLNNALGILSCKQSLVIIFPQSHLGCTCSNIRQCGVRIRRAHECERTTQLGTDIECQQVNNADDRQLQLNHVNTS